MRYFLQTQQRGFTLIEVLIALVLTSLLTGMLISAIFFASRTKLAVGQGIDQQLLEQANYSRFDQTLKYCLPEIRNQSPIFRGTASLVECFSTQNLQGDVISYPLNIRWTIQKASADSLASLSYVDQANWNRPVQIVQLPSDAHFVFWDAAGNKRKDWNFDTQQIRLLPARISIEFNEQSNQNALWSTTLRHTPHPDLPPPSFLGTLIQ
jgi:prepilin-type N-terminal cleavage/methylation domain-containing protein